MLDYICQKQGILCHQRSSDEHMNADELSARRTAYKQRRDRFWKELEAQNERMDVVEHIQQVKGLLRKFQEDLLEQDEIDQLPQPQQDQQLLESLREQMRLPHLLEL